MDPASGIGLLFEGASIIQSIIRTVKSFRKVPKVVDDLIEELEAFESLLNSLTRLFDNVAADESSRLRIERTVAPSIEILKSLSPLLRSHSFGKGDAGTRKLVKRLRATIQRANLEKKMADIKSIIPALNLVVSMANTEHIQ